jgi:hypothetical protein
VFSEFCTNGPFYWLRVPRDYAYVRQTEWVMAIARLVLSLGEFAAVAYARIPSMLVARNLLFCYVLYSIFIILFLRIRKRASPLLHAAIHCADILWTAHVSILTGWASLSFLSFIFILGSARNRWGFWELETTALGYYVLTDLRPLRHCAFLGIQPPSQALTAGPDLLICGTRSTDLRHNSTPTRLPGGAWGSPRRKGFYEIDSGKHPPA